MEFRLDKHHSLQEVSDPWDFNSDIDAEKLEIEMIQFMVKHNGIGLAANQIGIKKRVFVMGSETAKDFPRPFALFNPVIIEASKEIILDYEGCLSYPGIFLNVKRPSWIVARYQDSRGNILESKIEGYLSKCFQHELDHLNGVCFVDRVSRLKLQLAMKKTRKSNDRTQR